VAFVRCTICQYWQIEYHRFEPYLRQAVRAAVLALHPQLAADDAADANAAAGEDSAAARREYFVSFYHLPQIMRVRDLKTGRIGRLVSVSGTVTRSSDVRPELLRGTFNCRKCGLVAVGVEQQFIYTEPQRCVTFEYTSTVTYTYTLAISKYVVQALS
jgi:DNA replication licensing factor MCM6